MPDQSEAPIVRKLLRPGWDSARGPFVNPDGPEAAEIIRLCAGALRHAPIIGRTEPTAEFRERQDAWLNGLYRTARAKIKGQNP